MKKYPDEIIEYVRAHAQGTSVKRLVEQINEELGTDFTYSKMRALMSNYGIKNGKAGVHERKGTSNIFPPEIWKFITENYRGCSYQKMIDMVYERFGVMYNSQQINSFYGNHHLNSGLTGQFEKGHIPANKGRKGCCAPGSEKGWFQKGNVPKTQLPVGSEVIDNDGYRLVKIEEPNVWKLKHHIVWEEAYGKIPKDQIVIFLDGDKQNCALENLQCVTRAAHAVMNHFGLRSKNSELTEAGILVAGIKLAISSKGRKQANE